MKRSVLFATLSVLVLCIDLPAQTWIRKNDFPGAGRTKAVSFSINNQGYYGSGGQSGPDTIAFRKYDPLTDSWTSLPPLPVSTTVTDAFAIDNFGYVGLGYSGGMPARLFFRYDPSSNAWTTINSYPAGLTIHTATCTQGGKAYLLGGVVPNTSGAKDTCFTYDPLTNNWFQISPLPSPRSSACGFSINGFCYAALGKTTGDTVAKNIYRFNPGNNTWIQLSDYPGYSLGSGYGHFVLNNEVYFCNDSSQLWRYTPASDQWTRLSDTPFQAGDGGFVLNGIAYVIPEGTTQLWQYCPPMHVSAGVNTQICMGTSAQLQASGGWKYTWSPSSGLSNPNVSNPIASPANSTVYSVTVTDTNGCSASDSVRINVRLLPAIHSTAVKTVLCKGDTTSFTVTGGLSYTWQPVTELSNSTAANPKAWPQTNRTYIVTGIDSAGCINRDSIQLTVNANPVIAPLSRPSIACKGDICTLWNSTTDSSSSFVWRPAYGLIDSVGSLVRTIPLSTTTYTLFARNTQGCTSQASVTITVNPLPVLFSSVTPDTICPGDSAHLFVSGAATYIWNPSSTVSGPPPGSLIEAFPLVSTIYTVTGIDSNTCRSNATVSLQVRSAPAAPNISVNILVLSSDSPLGNQWYLNGQMIPGATGQTDTAKANGIYTVCVKNAAGCKTCSSPLSFHAMQIGENSLIHDLRLFPNPSQNSCTLSLKIDKENDLEISVYEMAGALVKSVFKGRMNAGTQEFQIITDNLEEGTYVIRVRISDEITQKRLIILK